MKSTKNIKMQLKRIFVITMIFVMLFSGKSIVMAEGEQVELKGYTWDKEDGMNAWSEIKNGNINGNDRSNEEKKIFFDGLVSVLNGIKEFKGLKYDSSITDWSLELEKNGINMTIAYYDTKNKKITNEQTDVPIRLIASAGFYTYGVDVGTGPIYIPSSINVDTGKVTCAVGAFAERILFGDIQWDEGNDKDNTIFDIIEKECEALSEDNELDEASQERVDKFVKILQDLVNEAIEKDEEDGTKFYGIIINDANAWFRYKNDKNLEKYVVWTYDSKNNRYIYGTGKAEYVLYTQVTDEAAQEYKLQLDELRNSGENITWTKPEVTAILAAIANIHGNAQSEINDFYNEDEPQTLLEKIITVIVQLVAVIGDAIDQTLAYIMYGDTKNWSDYNVLIDEPEYQIEKAETDTEEADDEQNENDGNSEVMINIGKMQKNFSYPRIKYSPEEIFLGRKPSETAGKEGKKIGLIDINFVRNAKTGEYTSEEIHKDRGVLRETIMSWYQALRLLAIVGLLSVLIYTGIRMILTSNVSDKAKYKQMIVDWIIALVILFSMHYIMSFIITVVDGLTEIFVDPTTGSYSITVKGDGTDTFKTNLMGAVRFGIMSKELNEQFMYLLMYFALVAFTVKFTYIYVKRTLKIAFLTLAGPLVAMTYPIDKMADGSAQGFETWLSEYSFNALIQLVHCLMYRVLITSAIYLSAANPIYAIAALGFMTQGEKMLRQIFRFGKGGDNVGGLSTGGAIATGAIASKALNKVNRVVNKIAKDKKEEQLKDMDKPGNMNAEDVDYEAFGPENSQDSARANSIRRNTNPLENEEEEDKDKNDKEEHDKDDNHDKNEDKKDEDGEESEKEKKKEKGDKDKEDDDERKNPFANLVKNIAEKPKKTSKAIMEKAGMKIKKAKNTKERIKYGLTHKKEVMRKLTLKGKHKLGRKLGWDKSKGRGYNFARLAAKTAAAGARLTAKVGVGAAVTAAMMGASLADGKPNPFRSLGAGLLAAKTSGKLMKKGEKLTGRAIKGVENLKREIKYGERRAYQMKYIDKMRNDEALYQKFVKKYGIEKADEMMQRMFQNYTGIVEFSDVKKGMAYSDKLSQRDVKEELRKFRSRAEQTKKENWEREVVEQKVVKDADGNDRLVEVTKKDKAEEMARDKKISYEDAVKKMKIEEYRNKENIDASESDESVEKKMKAAEKAQAEKEEARYKKGVADKVRAQTGNSKLTDDEAMLLKYRDKNDDIARKTIQGRAMIKDEDSRALYDNKERQSYIQQKLEDAGSPEERRQRKYYYDSLFRNIKQFDETVNR